MAKPEDKLADALGRLKAVNREIFCRRLVLVVGAIEESLQEGDRAGVETNSLNKLLADAKGLAKAAKSEE